MAWERWQGYQGLSQAGKRPREGHLGDLAGPACRSWSRDTMSNGCDPARTSLLAISSRWDFSRVCTAPAVMTPGSVHPGNATGMS